MTITLIDKEGKNTVINNSFPAKASGRMTTTVIMYLAMFAFVLIFLGTVTGGSGGILPIVIPFFGIGIFLSIAFASLNAHGGSSDDITIDRQKGSITIGLYKFELKNAEFNYRSTTYNNPLSQGWHDGDIMIITINDIKSGKYHEFKTEIDTMIELKDELREQLDIKMRKA